MPSFFDKIDPSKLLAGQTGFGFGPPPAKAQAGVDRATLESGRALVTKQTRRRQFITIANVGHAAKQLAKLPAADETIHLVIRANHFAPFDLLPAFIELAGQPAAEVILCSLGINDRHTEALDRMLTAGQVKRCDLLLSHYFSKVDAEEYARAAAVITKHGGQVAALRSHAKLILARFEARPKSRTPARHIVCESSANLRSCRSIEQAAIFNDRALFDFHAGWVRELIAKADPEKGTP